jgi:hypothetical protein
MNCIIGMCKPRTKSWICHLAELGYEPHFIEKTIKTTKGSDIQTDLIVTSNQLVHSLVVEVKGGITVNNKQIEKYTLLDKADLFNWVQLGNSFFTSERFQYDWCVSDVEENHSFVLAQIKDVPILTFGKGKIEKTGQFSIQALNEKFKQPIDIVGMHPPTLYYPFGEYDTDAYIARFAIQALLQVALKKSKGGPSVLDNALVTSEDILKFIFNPVFRALPVEHQNRLKERIRKVIRWVLADKEMNEAFGTIEQQGGYRLKRPLDNLQTTTQKFLANLETQAKLDPTQNPLWFESNR